MKELVYTACAAHVLWLVGSYVYDMLLGNGMRELYYRRESMESIASRMNKYWQSGRFNRELKKSIKMYSDVYANPKNALVAFKGKSHAKKGVILCCK